MGFFDGFWGLNSRAREAQNALGGLRQQYQQQMDAWNGRSGDAWNNATGMFDWSRAYWGDRASGGAPSIADIRGAGSAIMPYQDALTRMWERNNQIGSDWGGVMRSWDLFPQLQNNLNLQQQNITNESDFAASQIDETFGRAGQRADDTTQAVRGNIGGAYDSARDIIGGAYSGARRENQSTYDDILSRTGNAFRDMRSDVERLRPGGALQQATVARSFAPVIANANQRLRRSGLENSLAGSNVIGNAEVERARAMDDRAAQSTGEYVNASNRVRAGELGAITDALTSRLNNSINLGTQEAGLQSNLALGRGNAMSQEQIRDLAARTGLDMDALSARLGNSRYTTQQLNQNIRDRMNADILNRDMQRQDFQTEADLQRERNALEMTGLNLDDQQWQRGAQWQQWNRGASDQAAQMMAQLMQQQYGAAGNAAQTANQFGQVPLQSWQQQFNTESQNSGWGKRLLGGLAGSAIGAFTGGLGSRLGGWAGNIFGGATGAAGNAAGGWAGNIFGGGTRQPAGGGFNVSNNWMTGSPAQMPNNLFGNQFAGFRPATTRIGTGRP